MIILCLISKVLASPELYFLSVHFSVITNNWDFPNNDFSASFFSRQPAGAAAGPVNSFTHLELFVQKSDIFSYKIDVWRNALRMESDRRFWSSSTLDRSMPFSSIALIPSVRFYSLFTFSFLPFFFLLPFHNYVFQWFGEIKFGIGKSGSPSLAEYLEEKLFSFKASNAPAPSPGRAEGTRHRMYRIWHKFQPIIENRTFV